MNCCYWMMCRRGLPPPPSDTDDTDGGTNGMSHHDAAAAATAAALADMSLEGRCLSLPDRLNRPSHPGKERQLEQIDKVRWIVCVAVTSVSLSGVVFV